MNKINEINIEPATCKDADIAAKLTFMAYHRFSYDIFGDVGEEKALDYYKKLWLHGDNRFGYKYSYIAKVKNQPVSLMTCYPAALIKQLVNPTVRQLFRIGKVAFFCHFITHLSNFYYFSGTEIWDDEFYVATLSVLPEYRGMGIGAEQLRFARKLTKEKNLRRCTLHVSAENENGIKFYENNGFAKIKPTEKGSAYFRMVKTV